MTRPIGAFPDIKPVLDQALKSGGGVYELRSYKEAVRWRQRAYQYRAALQALERNRNILNDRDFSTPYDKLSLTLTKGSNVVVISFIEATGIFIPNNPMEEPLETKEDEFTLAAAELASQLSGGLVASAAPDESGSEFDLRPSKPLPHRGRENRK